RFNPQAFQGVLVTDKDLESTTYVFELEDGSKVEVQGHEKIEYDGEVHTAANLFDALKEGYYGKFGLHTPRPVRANCRLTGTVPVTRRGHTPMSNGNGVKARDADAAGTAAGSARRGAKEERTTA